MERVNLGQAEAVARELSGDVPMDDVLFVTERLSTFTVPTPSPSDEAALVERLRRVIPERPQNRFRNTGLLGWPGISVVGFLLAQARLYEPIWWIGTAAATFVWGLMVNKTGVMLGLLAPPLVAAGISYSFREAGSVDMEIELSCPVRPLHVMLVRLLLVMSWVVGLGMTCALILYGLRWCPNLALALWGWLAGMLFFGGATLVATLWIGPKVGLGVAIAAWVCLILWRTQTATHLPLWGIDNGTLSMVGLMLVMAGLLMERRLLRLTRGGS